jgi:ribosome-binding protein aMBF1 (putative translation factor)
MAAVKSRTKKTATKGRTKATAAKKTTTRRTAAKKGGASRAKKATATTAGMREETQKLGARIIDLRDKKGLPWKTVNERIGMSPSHIRRVYRECGGKGRRS